MKKREPGDIVAYRRRPRDESEILCHNHIIHTRDMDHGVDGFRWFTCLKGGDWEVCPCGWCPDLGVHHAAPDHTKWWRALHKRLGSQEAVDEYVMKQVSL
jgi:hypothetical protein